MLTNFSVVMLKHVNKILKRKKMFFFCCFSSLTIPSNENLHTFDLGNCPRERERERERERCNGRMCSIHRFGS